MEKIQPNYTSVSHPQIYRGQQSCIPDLIAKPDVLYELERLRQNELSSYTQLAVVDFMPLETRDTMTERGGEVKGLLPGCSRCPRCSQPRRNRPG